MSIANYFFESISTFGMGLALFIDSVNIALTDERLTVEKSENENERENENEIVEKLCV